MHFEFLMTCAKITYIYVVASFSLYSTYLLLMFLTKLTLKHLGGRSEVQSSCALEKNALSSRALTCGRNYRICAAIYCSARPHNWLTDLKKRA